MSMEDDAIGITCPYCLAPVGVNCVSVHWNAKDGKYIPSLHEKDEPHGKRVRRYEKFRYEGEND